MRFERGVSVEFEYKGYPEEIEVPIGEFLFQVWGGQGGTADSTRCRGGYSSGKFMFLRPTTLYIFVGGKGEWGGNSKGGFNGGGDGYSKSSVKSGGGGGASDIRLIRDDLSSRIIVAGGGGGTGTYVNTASSGGEGGGLEGNDGTNWNEGPIVNGKKGNQTSPGMGVVYQSNHDGKIAHTENATFGNGSNGIGIWYAGGGGGGGYFGGSGAYETGGGGGSGYVSPLFYSVTTLKGNELTDDLVHTGNGKIILTLISKYQQATSYPSKVNFLMLISFSFCFFVK